jgi:hypothetical protein
MKPQDYVLQLYDNVVPMTRYDETNRKDTKGVGWVDVIPKGPLSLASGDETTFHWTVVDDMVSRELLPGNDKGYRSQETFERTARQQNRIDAQTNEGPQASITANKTMDGEGAYLANLNNSVTTKFEETANNTARVFKGAIGFGEMLFGTATNVIMIGLLTLIFLKPSPWQT